MGVLLNPMEIMYWLPADALKLRIRVAPCRLGKSHKSIHYKNRNVSISAAGYGSQIMCDSQVSPMATRKLRCLFLFLYVSL